MYAECRSRGGSERRYERGGNREQLCQSSCCQVRAQPLATVTHTHTHGALFVPKIMAVCLRDGNVRDQQLRCCSLEVCVYVHVCVCARVCVCVSVSVSVSVVSVVCRVFVRSDTHLTNTPTANRA
jgi:hypothetical protein